MFCRMFTFRDIEVDDGVLMVLAGGRGLGVGLLERIGFKNGPLDPKDSLIISIGCMIVTSFPLVNIIRG